MTKQESAAIELAKSIAEAIRDLKQVPSGHLYARLMPYMDISTYNRIIAVLKEARLVKEEHHVLTWIG